MNEQNIMLMFNPNDQDTCNYKRIQQLCKEHDLLFRNQSFDQVLDTLKTRKFDTSIKRHVFTKEERKQFYEESPECNHCKNPVKAIAHGRTNLHDNIQMLCISCHADKTKANVEQGYVLLKSVL